MLLFSAPKMGMEIGMGGL